MDIKIDLVGGQLRMKRQAFVIEMLRLNSILKNNLKK